VSGKMENNMDKEFSSINPKKKDKEYGKMEKESSGWMNHDYQKLLYYTLSLNIILYLILSYYYIHFLYLFS